MQRILLKVLTFVVALGILFGSCSKSNNSASPATDLTSESYVAQDLTNFTSACNEIAEEADEVASYLPSTTGSPVKGATLDSLGNGIYVLAYTGLGTCGKTRKGWDSLFVIGTWNNKGSYIISKFNFTITNSNTVGDTMRLAGIDTIMNEGGGNLASLISGGVTSLTTYHYGTARVTFSNGQSNVWHYNKKNVRKFSGSQALGTGVVTSTITGLNNSSYPGVEVWGINRNGEQFYAEIASYDALSYSYNTGSFCTHGWPYSGIYFHRGILSNLQVTYGVTGSGVILQDIICPHAYMLNWTYLSVSNQQALAYF